MEIRSRQVIRLFFDSEEVLLEYRDLVWLSKYKFYVAKSNGQSKYLIANVKNKNRTIQIHRLILNAPKGYEIDHINNNGLDNRRSNLRIVTHLQNQNNLPKRKDATSIYRGVSYSKERNDWCCYVSYNGIQKNLGRFDSEIEAAYAYDSFIIKNNFPKKLNFGGLNVK